MRATYDSVVDGALSADRLVEPWLGSLQERPGAVRLFHAHTHVDRADPDGSCFFVAAAIARTPGVPLPEGAA